jgi:hypothetical protein
MGTVILAAAFALSSTPGIADADPTVSLAARVMPVAGFPHTGNIAGAGATLEVSLDTAGQEYGGHPPPLTHLNLVLPKGMHWDTTGFPTCPGPSGDVFPWQLSCPRGSKPQQTGDALLTVAFGTEVVPESASVNVFYRTDSEIFLEASGHSPMLVEDLALGRFVRRGTTEILEVSLPIVETVPNAPLMSTSKLSFFLGSAMVSAPHHHDFSLRMPSTCTQGHLTFKAEAIFASSPAQHTATASVPCPKKPLRHSKRSARH